MLDDGYTVGGVCGDIGVLLDVNNFSVMGFLKGIMENEEIGKRLPSSKAFYRWCTQRGIEMLGVTFDTELAGYLLNPSYGSYETGRLYSEYGGVADCDEKIEPAAQHSAVCDILGEQIKSQGFTELYNNIELPLAKVLASMEQWGFLVDAGEITAYGEKLSERISQLENEIYELVGYELSLIHI